MMRDIVFVMGLACSGKSHYISENFPDYRVVDIYDYQDFEYSTKAKVLSSYYKCAEELCLALEYEDSLILEHTLIKKKRRVMYLDIVKELAGMQPRAILLKPSIESFNKNRVARGIEPVDETTYEHFFSQVEIPSVEEGFSSVDIVEY